VELAKGKEGRNGDQADGGSVPIHNDSTFLYTDPVSAVGAWVALEECTPDNGCLVSLPFIMEYDK